MPRRRFNIDDCLIPSVYCGNKRRIPRSSDYNRYTRRGTAYECLRKGIGVGIYQEKDRRNKRDSLRNIRYVGTYYADRFKDERIRDIPALKRRVGRMTEGGIKRLIERVATNRSGNIDKRTYNSVILYLYRAGHRNVPRCKRIRG
jgi:hypothetical protein